MISERYSSAVKSARVSTRAIFLPSGEIWGSASRITRALSRMLMLCPATAPDAAIKNDTAIVAVAIDFCITRLPPRLVVGRWIVSQFRRPPGSLELRTDQGLKGKLSAGQTAGNRDAEVVAYADFDLSGGTRCTGPKRLAAGAQRGTRGLRIRCAKFVRRIPAGGGRVIACLKQHQNEVSRGCKSAIVNAMQGTDGGGKAAGSTSAASAIPANPPNTPTPPAAPAPATTAIPSTKPGGSVSGDRYFVMKQVTMNEPTFHQGQGGTAYTLMVPTSWQFKGSVNSNAGEYGCFADWFAAAGEGKSADGGIDMQFIPQYTFQYADDPAAQQQMQRQNQQDAKVGMKPCPVRAPMHAGDFLRQEFIAKYAKGKTVVSVDAFPELDQIARHRLGLPDGAGANGMRTEAARARLAYNDESGKPVEEWISAAVVVHSMPGGSGRGALYDRHVILVMAFRAPKGKLDENDKLFKLIAGTIHADPQWQQYSNGVITALYRKKQEEAAKQSAIIAQLQANVIATINGVVVNQQRGSYNSAAGADQLIREVQTFRNPSTGATFELQQQIRSRLAERQQRIRHER